MAVWLEGESWGTAIDKGQQGNVGEIATFVSFPAYFNPKLSFPFPLLFPDFGKGLRVKKGRGDIR